LKKNSNEKDFTFGVIDSSIPAIENSTNIIRNLQPILKVIPHGRIWLAPNTTLKKLTIESATGKLKSLSETAQKLRLKFK
jgi:methionine synthase II (cobalamin-independent)